MPDWIAVAVKHLLVLTVVLATQAGDSSCAPSSKACGIDTRGIRVEQGQLTDVITATCNPTPRTHRLDGWVEYRTGTGEQWRRAGQKETDHRKPDAKGLRIPVSAGDCVPGDYRTAWQATGVGPDPAERPFNYTDGDVWSTRLDCEE